jgi:hypothetical protein
VDHLPADLDLIKFALSFLEKKNPAVAGIFFKHLFHVRSGGRQAPLQNQRPAVPLQLQAK